MVKFTIDELLNFKAEEKAMSKVIILKESAPSECQLCHEAITDSFIDGRTIQGPWGYMCLRCHREHGVGLGTGKGQMYEKQAETGNFIKTQG